MKTSYHLDTFLFSFILAFLELPIGESGIV